MRRYIGIVAIALSVTGTYYIHNSGGYEFVRDQLDTYKIREVLFSQVSVISLVVFTLIFLTVFFILRSTLKKEAFYSKKQRKLRKINGSNDQKNGILYRWKVAFEWTGRPFISDLEIFCTRHGHTPLRFEDHRCPIQDCINHNQAVNKKFIHSHWESHLIKQWETIK